MRGWNSRLGGRLMGIVLVGLVAGATLGALGTAQADGARMVVVVSGLRTDTGEVRGAVFRSADGWTEPGREVATCRARISHGRARCVVAGLPPGTYAFAFLHDENGNGQLDRDLVGWPQEGYGFSNDAATGLGPPSFESASFDHSRRAQTMQVHARYAP